MAKKEKGQAQELKDLFPQPIVVPVKVSREAEEGSPLEYDDEVISVMPMDLARGFRLMGVLDGLDTAAEGTLLHLLALNADEIAEAIGIAINWPAARVERIYAPHVVELVTAIARANESFFVRSLPALVSAMSTMMGGAMTNGLGHTPSLSSGATPESPSLNGSTTASSSTQ